VKLVVSVEHVFRAFSSRAERARTLKFSRAPRAFTTASSVATGRSLNLALKKFVPFTLLVGGPVKRSSYS